MNSELDLIRKYFFKPINDPDHVNCGIGDDAALVTVPSGKQLVLSIDTLLEGVHFPASTRPEDIGYKSLAVNLSDMAAMGAVPRWTTMSLTLPEPDTDWLQAFSEGYFELSQRYSMDLIGGDLCRGPLSITIQVHGLVDSDCAVRRGGAEADQLIYVTGTLGDAGLGLEIINHHLTASGQDRDYLLGRLNRPVPRVEAGQALSGIAASMIDISDGLATDLSHILEESHVGAVVNPDLLPLSDAFRNNSDDNSLKLAMTSGDDYELCFTVSPDKEEIMSERVNAFCPVTCIGRTTKQQEFRLIRTSGEELKTVFSGYQHF